MIYQFIESAGGRRFILALFANIVTAGLVLVDKVSDTVYAAVVIATVGAHIAGNTIQKFQPPKE